MEGIKVDIIEYVDDHQPGWVKCLFIDAEGSEWSIIEKVPIVSQENLNSESKYPIVGYIAGKISNKRLDNNFKEIATIDLSTPWGISEESGRTIFDIFCDSIIKIA